MISAFCVVTGRYITIYLLGCQNIYLNTVSYCLFCRGYIILICVLYFYVSVPLDLLLMILQQSPNLHKKQGRRSLCKIAPLGFVLLVMEWRPSFS
jgi:hypothetical protein